ncbi:MULTISPECIES: acid phosphatase [unclassified Sphingomonas]|uniref:acid phosphatase n=1 Tax=unclassified Sphingomonas TaxID=196159 RepID=UPI0006F3C777|nr:MULTISPECIES: phosphatase PAP2 family protein [unclassified Sphingomonas]KQX20845.1 PA-phosphatase [Sphingomonas sp. Root1294]KQY68691.1 PA-phosphatase [Sphingomonas sp. Root50]KRB88096.1 PA-phosphatase [Sphingomonas sp. Root720]
MKVLRRAWKLAVLAGAAGIAIAAAPQASFLDPGYLNLIDVVSPAPIPQEARGVADREIFRLTRALKGTPRWDLAVADVPSDTTSMMRGFSCAAGISMTPANAPKTAALLEKAARDSGRETTELKAFYKKKRPFVIDSGETCEPQTDALAMSYDYPSGHATRGWTWGLVLAEILHERAAPILARARAYGESRIVCGVHNMSAVEAGRMVASSTMTVVRTEQAYADAVVAARAELAALRKLGNAPSVQACVVEEPLVTQPIFR